MMKASGQIYIPNVQLGDDMVQICVGGTGHQFERRQEHCKETRRTGAFQNSGCAFPPDDKCWIIVPNKSILLVG